MSLFTILRDSREQKPWTFDSFPVEVQKVTLKTGDYTLPSLCHHNEDTDTWWPEYAVERKSGQDLVHSITHERERFKAEIKRAKGWDDPMDVVIEHPWEFFESQRGFMKYRKVYPNQIRGTVDTWEEYYNVDFTFAESRPAAEQEAFDLLMNKHREATLSA